MSYLFKNFPDFLTAIREKPGMYTGGRSVTSLHLLLVGFGMAEYQYAIPEDKRLRGFDFNAFEDWIAGKYNPERLSAGSYYLARESAGSEEAGFLLWFQWYDEFRLLTASANRAVG
jgi:hypothetical protein